MRCMAIFSWLIRISSVNSVYSPFRIHAEQYNFALPWHGAAFAAHFCAREPLPVVAGQVSPSLARSSRFRPLGILDAPNHSFYECLHYVCLVARALKVILHKKTWFHLFPPLFFVFLFLISSPLCLRSPPSFIFSHNAEQYEISRQRWPHLHGARLELCLRLAHHHSRCRRWSRFVHYHPK